MHHTHWAYHLGAILHLLVGLGLTRNIYIYYTLSLILCDLQIRPLNTKVTFTIAACIVYIAIYALP